MANSWFMAFHPIYRLHDSTTITREMRDKLFLSAIQVIELSAVIEMDPGAEKWRWLSHSYAQWLPRAYVLAELCVRAPCYIVDRAWKAVDNTFRDGSVVTAKSEKWYPAEALDGESEGGARGPGTTGNARR